jgi:hypothetical protein
MHEADKKRYEREMAACVPARARARKCSSTRARRTRARVQVSTAPPFFLAC